jgi:hypothetical protein
MCVHEVFMNFYSTFAVSRILKIPVPRLQEWIRLGFIFPSQASSGRGSKALFSRADLYGIQLFLELLDSGLNRADARWITDRILEEREMRLQKDPVNWGKDYLNIYRTTSTKDPSKPFLERFTIDWGAPGVSQYFARREDPGKVPYWHLIIDLSEIKNIVDRELM